MLRRLYTQLLGHPRYRWIIIVASAIYLISPADLSPDVFPIIGWIDDGAVATLLATGITEVVLERRRAMKAKRQEGSGADQEGIAAPPPAADRDGA